MSNPASLADISGAQPTISPRSRFGGLRREVPRKDLLIYATLALLATVPYLNGLENAFVYDDESQVLRNPYIHSFRYVRRIFTSSVWSFQTTRIATNYYRPLMHLQYLILYRSFGPLAYAFHVTNVLWHAGVILLVFALGRRMFHSPTVGFIAAAIFALHPSHTEAVTWVAGISDLQLAFFLLAAFWFYLNLLKLEPLQDGRRVWTSIALLVCASLALLSKEPAVALPVLLIAFEVLVRGWPAQALASAGQPRGRRAALLRCGAMCLLTAVYLLCRMRFMGAVIPRLQWPSVSWPVAGLSAVSLFGEYMDKLMWPARLSMYYPFVPTKSVLDVRFLIGAACLLVLVLLCVILWKRSRVALFSIAWLCITLAPALNTRWMSLGVFAERYLYVPSIGFAWLAGYGVCELWRVLTSLRWRAMQFACGALAAALAAACVLRIVTRNADWRTPFSLYSVTVAQHPEVGFMRANLGSALWNEHQEHEAIREWEADVARDPRNFYALKNLGMAESTRGRYAQAIGLLRRALEIRPEFASARQLLASALAANGNTQEADQEFRQAIADSPLDWSCRNAYGQFLLEQGQSKAAEAQFAKSEDIAPNSEALDPLGDLALERKQFQAAEADFRQSVELNLYDHHAHFGLAQALTAQGRIAEAIQQYKLGLETDPVDPAALAALAQLQRQAR